MGTFDLTSTLDPTDEQLQALMEGIGEIGRRSSARKREIIDRMFKEALKSIPVSLGRWPMPNG